MSNPIDPTYKIITSIVRERLWNTEYKFVSGLLNEKIKGNKLDIIFSSLYPTQLGDTHKLKIVFCFITIFRFSF